MKRLPRTQSPMGAVIGVLPNQDSQAFGQEASTSTVSLSTQPPKFLTYRQVQELTGLSKTSLWRAERRTKDPFPQRIRISPRSLVWSEAEVLGWLALRPRGMTDTTGVK